MAHSGTSLTRSSASSTPSRKSHQISIQIGVGQGEARRHAWMWRRGVEGLSIVEAVNLYWRASIHIPPCGFRFFFLLNSRIFFFFLSLNDDVRLKLFVDPVLFLI